MEFRDFNTKEEWEFHMYNSTSDRIEGGLGKISDHVSRHHAGTALPPFPGHFGGAEETPRLERDYSYRAGFLGGAGRVKR